MDLHENRIIVYYETIKRQPKIKPHSECRCDERLKTKTEESSHLSDTGLFGELEHLKITMCLLLIDKSRAKDKTYI
jgi:hypothetical protein